MDGFPGNFISDFISHDDRRFPRKQAVEHRRNFFHCTDTEFKRLGISHPFQDIFNFVHNLRKRV